MINELPITLTSNPKKQIEIWPTNNIFTAQLYSIFSKIASGELLNRNTSRTDGDGPFFVGEPVGEMLRNLSQQRVSNLGFHSSSRHSSGFRRSRGPLFTNKDKEVSVFRADSLANNASNIIAFISHIKTFLEFHNLTGPLTTQAQLEQVELCLQQMLTNPIFKEIITNGSFDYGSNGALTTIPSVIHNNCLIPETHHIWLLDFFIYFHTETEDGIILTILSSRSNFLPAPVLPYKRKDRVYEISIQGALKVGDARSDMYHSFFRPPVGEENSYSTYCECLGYENMAWGMFRDGSKVSYRLWCVKKEEEKEDEKKKNDSEDSKIKKESHKISAEEWNRLFENICHPEIQKHYQEAINKMAEKGQTKQNTSPQNDRTLNNQISACNPLSFYLHIVLLKLGKIIVIAVFKDPKIVILCTEDIVLDSFLLIEHLRSAIKIFDQPNFISPIKIENVFHLMNLFELNQEELVSFDQPEIKVINDISDLGKWPQPVDLIKDNLISTKIFDDSKILIQKSTELTNVPKTVLLSAYFILCILVQKRGF